MKIFSKYRIVWITAAAVILLILFFLWQNNSITVSRYTQYSGKLPEAFDGYRIVHISDLHNKAFGSEQTALLTMVAAEQPNLIVVTGDLVDSRLYKLEPAMQLIRGCVAIAPTYYVSGNHEIRSGRWAEVKEAMQAAGAYVMDGATTTIEHNGAAIRLMGLEDGALPARQNGASESTAPALEDNGMFCVLLAHRPEYFAAYCNSGADMVFCGHAHGGQVRLPFIGGLYAPGQGWFPKYTSGAYTQGGTTMYVSRGLGNSLFPFRVFNRPELVTVVLQRRADDA